jgi:hypothetical protein
MTKHACGIWEIESFNLADLNVSALDMRLELTGMIPACTLVICEGNYCPANGCSVHCTADTGCLQLAAPPSILSIGAGRGIQAGRQSNR